MALADRLQRVLDLRGLTPYDLSKRAGLSQSQVRIWIDRKSERVSTEALSAEPANREPVANDGPMQLKRPVWMIDRLAQVLNLTLIEERMPSLVLGAFVRAQSLIIIQPDLRPDVRTVVVPHECSHGALHPRAPHAEVWYLALALLLPQRLLERLPPGRPPTAAALAQLVPYRVAAWVATTRARILARAFNAIAL